MDKNKFRNIYVNRLKKEFDRNLYNEYSHLNKNSNKEVIKSVVCHHYEWLEYEGGGSNYFTHDELIHILQLYNSRTGMCEASARKKVKFLIINMLIQFLYDYLCKT